MMHRDRIVYRDEFYSHYYCQKKRLGKGRERGIDGWRVGVGERGRGTGILEHIALTITKTECKKEERSIVCALLFV